MQRKTQQTRSIIAGSAVFFKNIASVLTPITLFFVFNITGNEGADDQ